MSFPANTIILDTRDLAIAWTDVLVAILHVTKLHSKFGCIVRITVFCLIGSYHTYLMHNVILSS